jgi:hypothetical protein
VYIIGVYLTDVHLIDMYLINVHLTGVHLIGVHLIGVNVMGVYLTSVYLMGVYLINIHLTDVHLIGVYIIGVHLISVYLTGVYLISVYLTGVHLIPLQAGIKAHLVALVACRVLPPKQLQKVAFVAPPIPTKDMKSPRPKRLRRDRVPWEAAVASTLGAAKKAERKAPRTSKTKALKPIPLEPLPPSIERPLPYYTP